MARLKQESIDSVTTRPTHSTAKLISPQPQRETNRKMSKPTETMKKPKVEKTELENMDISATAIEHEHTIPSKIPVKDTVGKFGLMHPTAYTLDHEASDMLLDWAKNGCPVDTGPNWTKEQIKEALARGPHQSAFLPGAREFLLRETKEKVKHGYAKLIRYGDIKDRLPENFKLSPISMIPHKSKEFRTILDLSFQLRHKGTKDKYESVNSATTKLAPQQAMGTSMCCS